MPKPAPKPAPKRPAPAVKRPAVKRAGPKPVTAPKKVPARPAAKGGKSKPSTARNPAPAGKAQARAKQVAPPAAVAARPVLVKGKQPATKGVKAKPVPTKPVPARPAKAAAFVAAAGPVKAAVPTPTRKAIQPAPRNGTTPVAAKPAAAAPPPSRPAAPAEPSVPPKPKKNGAGLGLRDLQHFADLLLQKRREIVGDMHSMEGEALRSGSTGLSNLPIHPADMGTDNYEQEFTLGLVEKDRSLLREINHALGKIPAGTYGICEGTGETIGRPRLEVQPWARYSIEHARQRERNGHGVRMFF